MPGVEFIGRFLRHVLPLGLRHIRRFGFMGPRVRTAKLKQIRELLGLSAGESVSTPVPETDPWSGDSDAQDETQEGVPEADEPAPRRCRCGGQFVLVAETPRPTVAELMQMPPSMETTASGGSVQLHLPLSGFL